MKDREKERWLALARECIIQAGRLPDWLDEVAEKLDMVAPDARQWAYDFVKSRVESEVGK